MHWSGRRDSPEYVGAASRRVSAGASSNSGMDKPPAALRRIMRVSVLDLFCRPEQSIELAVEADRLGFHRYWVGEHHFSQQCNNPLVLCALAAGVTSRIRVGTGGVCLKYRNPYLVAEDACLIERLLPCRFDLGVTSGLALSPAAIRVLTGETGPECTAGYHEKFTRLHRFVACGLSWYDSKLDRDQRKGGPPIWVLGTDTARAALAAQFGVGFCLSLHHARDAADPGILELYRRDFRPSHEFPEPTVILAVSGICAPTAGAARCLTEAYHRVVESSSKALGTSICPRQTFCGDPSQCAVALRRFAETYGADELMIISLIPGDNAAILEMNRLLAREMQLAASFG